MGFALKNRRCFDDWAKLAQADPTAFENARREAIEQFILDAPEEKQEWLRCIQWRVDQIRQRSGSPLGACIKISNMMMDALAGEKGLLEALGKLEPDEQEAHSEPECAQIYPFPTGKRP